MATFIVRRAASLIAVVVLVTAATWVVIHVLRPEKFPDDPRPLLVQLAGYLERVFLHLDLGRSWAGSQRPVAELLGRGLPADLWLLGGGIAFGVGAGVAGGAVCAARPNSAVARVLEALAVLFLCTPVYVVGLTLLLLFGAGLALVDVGVTIPTAYVPFGESPARWFGSLLAPWIVLGLPLAGLCLRTLRGEMREVLGEDCLRTAVGKGLSRRRVVGRHAVPLAAAPTLSASTAAIPIVVTNVVLVEHVFSVPGAFQDLTDAMATANFPLLLGMTIVVAALVALGSLVLDVALAWLDPRVR